MNNDAFRKMVQDRSRVKSTKEIARAAVEAEFKKKNKKRRRGGGDKDYSSDSDDEDKHNKKRSNKNGDPFGLYLRPKQLKASGTGNNGGSPGEADEEERDSKYRDRAKERREGKQRKDKDSNDDQGEMQELKAQNTKGLDLTELREAKQRIKEKNSRTGDHRLLMRQEEHILPSFEEACVRLEKLVSDPEQFGSLPSGLTEYLTHLCTGLNNTPDDSVDTAICGVAGKNIQKSRLVMAIEGRVGDKFQAWERPREVTHPNPQDFLAPPRLQNSLVRSIEHFSAKPKMKRQTRKPKTGVTKDAHQSSSYGTSSKSGTNDPKEKIGSKGTSAFVHENHNSIGVGDNNGGDSDDDDDIFGGLDDYIPPTATTGE